jgi:hypothetical protein
MGYTLVGIDPAHVPALVAALLLPLVAVPAWRRVRARAHAGAGWAESLVTGWAAATAPTRWAVWLLLTTAVIHLALPLGDRHHPMLAVLFLASGAAFARFAWRAVVGDPWRALTALLLLANLGGYLVVIGFGIESSDQVGLVTALVELLALALVVVPALDRARPLHRRLLRPLANAGVVMLTLFFGGFVWQMFFASHHQTVAEGNHHHHENTVAGAQAGMLQRPGGPLPDQRQRAAAADLAARTRTAVARYDQPPSALADGYLLADDVDIDLVTHYAKPANEADDRLLDPEAPEQLVYGIDKGKVLLLGVLYKLPEADMTGPRFGGSLTRWHAHNVCAGFLPPGAGLVSPLGGCPPMSLMVTDPDMIHVWTVDPPGGPYTEHLDKTWLLDLIARDGVPL